ncbi:MAG: response regulator [Flavobacteriales bacterium]|nr:response regulator [Flavobacteriales bacterium]
MDKIKVLYIDDELVNLSAFKASFRRIFDVHVAQSAEQGIEILRREPIEVIISDQRMPNQTGVDFFESILDVFPNPVRILLTAYSDINAIIDAINKGQVYRYVTKPWSEFDLKLTIENAYRLYTLQEQNNKLNTKYSRLFNESSDPILLFDVNGRIVDYNEAAVKLLDASKNELHFTSFYSFIKDKTLAARIIETLKTENEITDFECAVVTQKNEEKFCLISANAIKNSYGEVINYQAILKDITTRKQVYKTLLKTIIETQEKERERIAKDLHDGLGQTLAAIKLNMDAVKSKREFSDTECKRIETLLESSTQQLRDICFNTLPSTLSQYGIVKAIEELINKSSSEKLEIRFICEPPIPPLDKSLEIGIYRIVQEFINNSIKHSQANEVVIALENKENNLSLNLFDNGQGFIIKDLMIYQGQGLKNIESRVKSLSGDVTFKSEINKGTEFNISFPIHLN